MGLFKSAVYNFAHDLAYGVSCCYSSGADKAAKPENRIVNLKFCIRNEV